MDINKEQNLMDNGQKSNELKEIINLDNDENETPNTENKESQKDLQMQL